MPPNVFTNFSPLTTPPAVNVLVLDALNTPMSDQMYLKKAAQHYLKTLKPGSRIAIFTMSMRLSFIQGFSDDPVVLATALGYRKNDRSEPAVLLQSQAETYAQGKTVEMMVAMEASGGNSLVFTVSPYSIAAFQQFLQETRYAQDSDREYRTLQNLNELAAFLGSFPGRKNVIWMSGSFPVELFGQTAMRFEGSIEKTVNLLSAARVAIYPVDVRGTNVPGLIHRRECARSHHHIGAAVAGPTAGSDRRCSEPGRRRTFRHAAGREREKEFKRYDHGYAGQSDRRQGVLQPE